MLVIDGSVLEGGGQIIRISIALSALCRKSVKIVNIRAARKNAGLASQHLKGIELVKRMCNANTNGLEIGSKEIEFHPNDLRGGDFVADAVTAGSVALLLQVSLPVALFCNEPVNLILKGGTNAEMAPQIDFITEIFRPNLERFGATFDFDLTRRGYFPRGGGICHILTKPVKEISAAEISEFGEVKRFFGWSFVSGTLPIGIANEMEAEAKKTIKSNYPNKPIEIEVYKETQEIARDNCSGIIIGCETSSRCILGGSALGSRKESSRESGKRAANEILQSTTNQSCVDQHVQDQLIIFMALATGESKIKCDFPLTMHTQTAIYVAELITNVRFSIEENNKTCVISCTGIGLRKHC